MKNEVVNCSKVAERIKKLRVSKGLSHEKLSNELRNQYGISISTDSLQNYEVIEKNHSRYGKIKGMKIEYLICLADYFGVSTDYILGLTDIRDSDVDVIEICKKVGLSEEAAQKFCRTTAAGESGSPLVFLNSMMLLPDELLERLSNCFVAYILVQYLGVSGIKEKYNFPGNLSLSLSVNNFKLPEVSIDESSDYSRFELTRSVVQAADCISSSAYAAKIRTLFCGGVKIGEHRETRK